MSTGYVNPHAWTIAEQIFAQDPKRKIVTILPPESSRDQSCDVFFRGDIYDENGEIGNDGRLDVIWGRSSAGSPNADGRGSHTLTGETVLRAAITNVQTLHESSVHHGWTEKGSNPENNAYGRIFIGMNYAHGPKKGQQTGNGYHESSNLNTSSHGCIRMPWNLALRMKDEATENNPVTAHNLRTGDKSVIVRVNSNGQIVDNGGLQGLESVQQSQRASIFKKK